MPPYLWYALAGVALFCIGFCGVLLASHLLRKIIALNICASGVFLLLISIARRNFIDEPDAVPHAMVLTGIVIALGASAFAITIARRIHATTGATALSGFSAQEEEGL
jgi:multicomponent Na+:H+ antiporter subunit C